MKVLFVYSGTGDNGASPIIEAQAKSLEQEGASVLFFPIRGKGILAYLTSIPRLRSYLSKEQVDIIHAHYGLSGIVAACAKTKHKLVVSFMGDDLIGINAPDGSYTFTGRVIVWLSRILARRYCDSSIVKSEAMQEHLPKGVYGGVLPNGVDLSVFCPADKQEARALLGLDLHAPIIIFVSSPERPEKNFALAQDAVGAVKGLFPDVQLIVVNGVKHADLPMYYSAADVLMLTSFHEGSPNVIKEAMACNCPVVSTDVGDVRKVFGTVEGCYICSYEAPEAGRYLEKALRFAKSKDRTQGRRYIVQLGLGASAIARRLLLTYQNLVVPEK